jgi:hypothetical protein
MHDSGRMIYNLSSVQLHGACKVLDEARNPSEPTCVQI